MTTRAPCQIEGCERPIHARGWCHLHYERWRRHGDPLTVHQPHVIYAERYEDVTDLLAAGEAPERIAARLGTTCAALARGFHRHGDHDLARLFDRAAHVVRRQRTEATKAAP